MYVKIRRGRLKDLPTRHQCLLQEWKLYYVEDTGDGVVIPLDIFDLYIDNTLIEREKETRPDKPIRQVGTIYNVTLMLLDS